MPILLLLLRSLTIILLWCTIIYDLYRVILLQSFFGCIYHRWEMGKTRWPLLYTTSIYYSQADATFATYIETTEYHNLFIFHL